MTSPDDMRSNAASQQDLDVRLDLLRQCERQFPDDADTKQEIGKCLLRQARYPQAEEALRVALSLDENAWTHLYLANLYLQTKDLDRAESECAAARDLRPDLTAPLWCLAGVREAKGDSSGAKELYVLALNLDPDCHESLARLGRMYLENELRAEGLVFVRRALRANPESRLARKLVDRFSLDV